MSNSKDLYTADVVTSVLADLSARMHLHRLEKERRRRRKERMRQAFVLIRLVAISATCLWVLSTISSTLWTDYLRLWYHYQASVTDSKLGNKLPQYRVRAHEQIDRANNIRDIYAACLETGPTEEVRCSDFAIMWSDSKELAEFSTEVYGWMTEAWNTHVFQSLAVIGSDPYARVAFEELHHSSAGLPQILH